MNEGCLDRERTMKIVLVGAGNVSFHLAPALRDAGAEVVAVWSRMQTHAESVAMRADAVPFCGSLAQLPSAEVYIIATKDDAVSTVAKTLCPLHPEALFLHMAGSLVADVLAEAGAKRYGVLYPMQTFSRQRAVDFRTVPLFVEASGDAELGLLRMLARSLSPHVRELASMERRHLHLAAVFACNFANHCYALAADEMERAHLPFSLLLPLIDETAGKVHALSPQEAQTGPAVRGDGQVVEQQRMLLSESVVREVFDAMCRSIRHHAEATSFSRQHVDDI